MVKKVLGFVVALIVVIGLSSFLPLPNELASAQGSDNVAGHAWSSNIGWIKMFGTAIAGGTYGVQYDPNTKEFSGYAWSSNIGWVNFKPSSPFPSTPNHGVKLSDDKIIGWARVCSVFTSGCGGSLKPDLARGGFDGWIKMSGTAQNGQTYGVTLNTSTRALSGYAWGDEVVGWVDFSRVSCPACVIPPPIDYDANLRVTVAGSGQVTDGDDKISCGNSGSDCSETYDKRDNTEVILTATGADFTGWGGDCSGAQRTCTLRMSADRNVTADFTHVCDPAEDCGGGGDPDLTVVIVGQGSVTGAGVNCTSPAGCKVENINNPTDFSLLATPASGSSFVGWAGCDSVTSQTCSVRVNNSDKTVTVTFDDGDGCEGGDCPEGNAFSLSCQSSYDPDGNGPQPASCSVGLNCNNIPNGGCTVNNVYSQQRASVTTNYPGVSYSTVGWSVGQMFDIKYCSSQTQYNDTICTTDITKLNDRTHPYVRFYKKSGFNPISFLTPVTLKAVHEESGDITEKTIWLNFTNTTGTQQPWNN